MHVGSSSPTLLSVEYSFKISISLERQILHKYSLIFNRIYIFAKPQTHIQFQHTHTHLTLLQVSVV